MMRIIRAKGQAGKCHGAMLYGGEDDFQCEKSTLIISY